MYVSMIRMENLSEMAQEEGQKVEGIRILGDEGRARQILRDVQLANVHQQDPPLPCALTLSLKSVESTVLKISRAVGQEQQVSRKSPLKDPTLSKARTKMRKRT